jgi:hypothetical protein
MWFRELEEESSFLKKRSKKLLPFGVRFYGFGRGECFLAG